LGVSAVLVSVEPEINRAILVRPDGDRDHRSVYNEGMMIKHLMQTLRNIFRFCGWLIERHDRNEHFRNIVEQHEELLRR